MSVESYWAQLDDELARFPARPVLEPAPARSTEDFTGYDVRLSGLGSYRLFGYLSVPTGSGRFPGLLELPRHGSVNHAPHYNDRLRYVVFTLMHRGQRRADSPFAATYPGLFTQHLTDPASYVYRGIVADCLRAAEFLSGRPEVDTAAIGVTGDDLALLTAARRPVFSAVKVTSALLHDALARRLDTSEYPLEELNDHLRARPEDAEDIARTLELFEPARHASAVKAPTLLAVPSGSSPWRADLSAALGEHVETYQRTDEDAVDAAALDAWLAGRLGVEPMRRFIT